MTWRWSSWVFCAPEASPILEKVNVKADTSRRSVFHRCKFLCGMDGAWPNWSYFPLFTVFQEFVRFTNKDIEQIIKKEMSGDVKNAFYAIGNNCLWPSLLLHLTLESHCWQLLICDFLLSLFAVRSVKNQPSYFADRLYKAMKVFIHSYLKYVCTVV